MRQTAVALGYGDQFRGTRATPGDPNELMAKSADELDAALAEAVTASIAGREASPAPPATFSKFRKDPQSMPPLSGK